MSIQEELDELRQIVSNDKIGDLTTAQLERYTNALCFSRASDYFSATQFSQVCETIRLLLFKKYIEATDKKNTLLQYLVIAVSIMALVCTIAQVYISISSISVKQVVVQEQKMQKQISAPTSTPILK